MNYKELDIEHETAEIEQMKEPNFEINSYSYEEENSFTIDNEDTQFKNEHSSGSQWIEVDKEPIPEEKLRLLTAYFNDVSKEDLFSHEEVLKVSATIKKYEEMADKMGKKIPTILHHLEKSSKE